MTSVQISPEVKLQEIHQLVSHLQNRNLFLAESFRTVRDIGLEYERQIAEKDARIAELEQAVTEARAMVANRDARIVETEDREPQAACGAPVVTDSMVDAWRIAFHDVYDGGKGTGSYNDHIREGLKAVMAMTVFQATEHQTVKEEAS